MKFKIVSAIAALTLLVSAHAADARNPGINPGNPGNNFPRKLGGYEANCNSMGDSASSSFQNVPNSGPAVQLLVNQFGYASTTVEGLNTSNVTMLGGIQFFVTGPIGNFDAVLSYTAPGGGAVITKVFTVGNGIVKASQANLYFIPTNLNSNGNQIPPGARITALEFELQGSGGGQITNRISGVSFTGYGGVGYNTTEPAAFCNNSGGG